MRKVAGYVFETSCSSADRTARLDLIEQEVLNWLRAKGTIHEGEGAASLELDRGGFADLKSERVTVEGGNLLSWVLTEYGDERQFRTSIEAAGLKDAVSFRCVLEVGGFGDVISPLSFDARTPHIVRRLLDVPDIEWVFGSEPVPNRKLTFSGRDGGDEFAQLVWSKQRGHPVVAVSQDQGTALHPDIAEMFAYDLAGLASVAELDSTASWRLTETKTRDWSVYGGAIRLYWPRPRERDNPFAHPLWTPRRLLTGVSSAEEAVERIRRQLQRSILSASAFSMPDPTVGWQVRRQARREQLERLRDRAEAEGGHKQLADELFEKLLEAEEDRGAKAEHIRNLEDQVRNLQEALRWHPSDEDGARQEPDEVVPETEAPPVSVEEAVLRARERFGARLVFGEQVMDGVRMLSPDAGPPEKVFTYLEELHNLARSLSQGALGNSVIGWLKTRGVSASHETELIRSSERERMKRTWEDGSGGRRFFDLHLKPNESTSPDRCVRIYCEVETSREVVVVGWVGRHP